MATIELYDLSASPNSMKIRVALGYKGIPYEQHPVDGSDMERKQIVELSGQPLTPVIRHGDIVVCDSASILRYLDTNFRDTPPLLFAERSKMQEAERLEKWVRGPLTEPIGVLYGQAMSETPDPAVCRQANERFHELTAEIESRLESSEWPVGERMSFVDVTAAPTVFYSLITEAIAGMHPLAAFFRANLRLGENRERTREWAGRVMAYDRGMPTAG